MRDIRHSHLRKFFDCLMNLLSEELFVPSVKILLFYCLNIRTFANETNRRRNALSVRIQTEQVKKRELITPCNRPVRLIYCESGIDSISSAFPYFVYEYDGELIGYCYAHLWKEREAYQRPLRPLSISLPKPAIKESARF